MSIVRKHSRATKGTKKWRKNIDVTDLMLEVEEQERKDKLEKAAQEKLKNQKLFYIDQQPDAKVRERLPLDPNRFKKRPSNAPLSKAEGKKLSKIAQKQKEKEQQKLNQISTTDNTESDEIKDVWEEERPVQQKTELPLERIKVPVVLPPHSGQSYNPVFKAHKELLEQVIEEEKEKEYNRNFIEYENDKVPVLPKQKKRIRNVKERIEAEEKAARKQERQLNHDFMNLKSIIKNLNKKSEEHAKELQEIKEAEEQEKKLIEEGKLVKARRIGRAKYEYKGTDFQLTSELTTNLRTLKTTGNLLSDRYDSLFRRNLIEPPRHAKKKKSRFPKYKFHSIERGHKDDESLQVHK